MRPVTCHPSGLMVPRSPAIFSLTVAVVVALSGLTQAQAADQPKTAPTPKAPAEPAASPEKLPAEPAPAEAAPPAAVRRSYEPLPYTDGLKTKRTEVQRWLRGGEIPADQRRVFESYFKEYEIGRWTQPDQLNQLPIRRRELINALKTAKISSAHDELVALSLDFLGTLAGEPKRHPAARFNAMMAIGELNRREADGEDPQPLPEALPLLLGASGDVNQIDAVRVAAILGLYRHAALGIADAQFRDNQLIPAMLALVQSKTAAGRAPEGHAWMRSRAIDVLGMLGEMGQQGAVPKALAVIVADRDEDLLVRCAAARALGSLVYPANHGLDAWKLSSELGQLASDACLAEFERMDKEAEQEKRKQRRPLGAMMGMGYEMGMDSGMMAEPDAMSGGAGMPGGFGRPKEETKEDVTLGNRRRLLTSLNAAFIGLTGMKWSAWTVWARRNNTDQPTEGVASLGAAGPQADLITGKTGLLKPFEGLFAACEEAKGDEAPLDRETLRSKIETALSPLTQALNAGRPPDAEVPAEAAPPDEAEVPADAAKPAAKPAEPAPKPAEPAPKPAEPAPKPAAGPPAGNP